MYKFITFLIILFSLQTSLQAQIFSTNDRPDLQKKRDFFSVGVKFENNFSFFPNDYRFGFNIGSPLFLGGRLGLRAEYDYCTTRGIPADKSTLNESYANYYAVKAGVIMSSGNALSTVRPYLETGIQYIWTNPFFTSISNAWGSYGVLGFDFTFSPTDLWGYFLEGGVLMTMENNQAEKFYNKIHYSEGIILSAGIRYYF